MLGQLRRHSNLNERRDNVIRPENLHHFQRTQHHGHQHPWQVQHFQLNRRKCILIVRRLIQIFQRRIHRTIRQHKDPRRYPCHGHDNILRLQEQFVNILIISIRSGDDQEHITDIMNHQQEYPNHPEVHHERKEYQEHR